VTCGAHGSLDIGWSAGLVAHHAPDVYPGELSNVVVLDLA